MCATHNIHKTGLENEGQSLEWNRNLPDLIMYVWSSTWYWIFRGDQVESINVPVDKVLLQQLPSLVGYNTPCNLPKNRRGDFLILGPCVHGCMEFNVEFLIEPSEPVPTDVYIRLINLGFIKVAEL